MLYKLYFKRIFDFFFALTAIIALSPLLCLIALGLRLFQGSPILFKQKRPGLNEKPFIMVKFKTMSDACDSFGKSLPDDKRLTKFGSFLRATSLDELPELFNVLMGNMSLVGPRPLLSRYLPYYTEEERKRHSVRPGLTGLAQINGRNFIQWEERFKLDNFYVDNISFSSDIMIIFKTIYKVVFRDGVSVDANKVMPDLDVYRQNKKIL